MQSDYTIMRYVSVMNGRGRTLRRFAKEARAAGITCLPNITSSRDTDSHSNGMVDDFIAFPDLAFDLADALRRAVFVDQVRRLSEKRTEVIKLLKEHVHNNIVKVSSD